MGTKNSPGDEFFRLSTWFSEPTSNVWKVAYFSMASQECRPPSRRLGLSARHRYSSISGGAFPIRRFPMPPPSSDVTRVARRPRERCYCQRASRTTVTSRWDWHYLLGESRRLHPQSFCLHRSLSRCSIYVVDNAKLSNGLRHKNRAARYVLALPCCWRPRPPPYSSIRGPTVLHGLVARRVLAASIIEPRSWSMYCFGDVLQSYRDADKFRCDSAWVRDRRRLACRGRSRRRAYTNAVMAEADATCLCMPLSRPPAPPR